jgi:cysteine synthase
MKNQPKKLSNLLLIISGEIVSASIMEQLPEKLKKLEAFVGNTPTIRLFCNVDGKSVDILAKYEAWNFSGSIKDRMAFQILKAAYLVGSINPSDTIVEATSGNTGIAFAAMGAYLGHPVQIYMPSWLSKERKRLLRFYGAKLFEITAKQGGFQRCIELSAKKSTKNGFFGPKQFENSWNVLAHTQTTAPELENVLKINKMGDLDAFITGMGTGGTIMGFYHYFSQKKNDFKAYPILPDKNEDGGHRIEGIGDSFIPKIVDLQALSPVLRVNDADAINIARQINKLGLSVGISSGANVFGAIIKKSELEIDKNVGTILCDCNKKYLTTDLCSNSEEKLSRQIKILDFEIIA